MRIRKTPVVALVVAIPIVAVSTWADRVEVAADGSPASVRAAMTRLTTPGVVVIPPGQWEFDGTLNITANGVTLLGCDASQTLLLRAADGPTTAARNAPFVQVTNTDHTRVTGLSIQGVPDPTSAAEEYGVLLTDSTNFRVDHVGVSHTGFAGVRTTGACTGVVDHSTFDSPYRATVGTLGYGVVVYGIDQPENVPLGSDRATFIEDSSFRMCRHAAAANSAARFVFRDNHVVLNQVAHAIDAHGIEFGSNAGTEWVEAYDNIIEMPIYAGYAVRLRGGIGAIWDNTIVGYDLEVRLTQDTPQATGPIAIWDNMPTPTTTPVVLATGVMGTPTYTTAPPASYQPYQYPHPLVTDLVANAGVDQAVTTINGATAADVTLDGSTSQVSQGSIAAYRWWIEGSIAGTGAVSSVNLAAGTHLVVLEAERDDGYREYDCAMIQVAQSSLLQPDADTDADPDVATDADTDAVMSEDADAVSDVLDSASDVIDASADTSTDIGAGGDARDALRFDDAAIVISRDVIAESNDGGSGDHSGCRCTAIGTSHIHWKSVVPMMMAMIAMFRTRRSRRGTHAKCNFVVRRMK